MNLKLHLQRRDMSMYWGGGGGGCNRNLKAFGCMNEFQGSLYESFINVRW